MQPLHQIASEYSKAVHDAARSAVSGEPEAQLTTPVSNLFVRLSETFKVGTLSLIRETRLDRTRPDFAVFLMRSGKIYQKGFIELKAPSISVDATTWKGRNASQWERMKVEAEILIVCNGAEAQLYKNGDPLGDAVSLPYDKPGSWNPAPLVALIIRFLETSPSPITSVSDLSRRLAIRTADLRDRLLWLFAQTGTATDAAKGSLLSWQQHVHPDTDERKFADGISQVISYGMVLAALSAIKADVDEDGQITVAEARNAIRKFSPVLAAAFAPLVDKPALYKAVQVEIGVLETLISSINPERVNKSADRRGEPWLYFYEDFLSVYDPEARKQAGVYYTPVSIVKAMVNIVDYILVERFEKRLGFADPSVNTLDPATGTGTFPLAVIDKAVERAIEVRGKAGKGQAVANVAKNLFAFELLPGPYSVAQLRLNQRLTELSPGYIGQATVILTDTLESPLNPKEQLSLFGDAETLAAEQNRAKRIKLEQKVTVVIGNPPYRRVESGNKGRGLGGWVVDGKVPGRKAAKSLFDDILDVAKKHTNFAHHASLYNLYVYFWRWSIWKAFEAHGNGPGVVAFITGSSWLSGPGFMGLRQLVRESCDEAWVIDLGGDNRGGVTEDNVFSIETPVSVVILIRAGTKDAKKPAVVKYRRVDGTSADKLAAMAAIATSVDPLSGDWQDGPIEARGSFRPVTGGAAWEALPKLVDIFPWQQPGCKFGRTWPIAPSKEILEQRWEKLVGSKSDERSGLFMTANFGRTVETKVGTMRRLADLSKGDPSEPIVRYGFRSFDRQWAFQDPRMAKTESPSLWNSSSPNQVYLTSMMTGRITSGPAMTVTADVPDLHYFAGRGGKDIIPLYRDAAAIEPNITKGLQAVLAKEIGISAPTAPDIAAYVYALLSCASYQALYAVALETPGPRVPFVCDKTLWVEAVEAGRNLLWLHTYAERFRDAKGKRGKSIPLVPGIGWTEAIEGMPTDSSDISYNIDDEILSVGTGRISGVRPSVWEFEVGGMQICSKWLGYRTIKGAGRSVSSKSKLDAIRLTKWPDEWNDELLDLIRVLTLTVAAQDSMEDLFGRIVSSTLIPSAKLPKPKDVERLPPREAGGLLVKVKGKPNAVSKKAK